MTYDAGYPCCADYTRMQKALQLCDRYFTSLAAAWSLNDGKLVDENGSPYIAATGLDELCEEAAIATKEALKS